MPSPYRMPIIAVPYLVTTLLPPTRSLARSLSLCRCLSSLSPSLSLPLPLSLSLFFSLPAPSLPLSRAFSRSSRSLYLSLALSLPLLSGQALRQQINSNLGSLQLTPSKAIIAYSYIYFSTYLCLWNTTNPRACGRGMLGPRQPRACGNYLFPIPLAQQRLELL